MARASCLRGAVASPIAGVWPSGGGAGILPARGRRLAIAGVAPLGRGAGAWGALLAFCLKSGMSNGARLISPYYPLLLPWLVLGRGHEVLVRQRLPGGFRDALPMINLLNPDGTYNENAGKYSGIDRLRLLKRVVDDLKALDLLERVDSYLVRLNHSDRSKTPIEPYLSDQWFVRMGEDAGEPPGFAQQAMDAVISGRVTIHPERYAKSYLDWLGEKRDWCISRQLWWGHRIPIWYCGTCARTISRGPSAVAPTWPGARPRPAAGRVAPSSTSRATSWELAIHLAQDPDVLDTWFSSALWPHSTLGWPDETPELRKYYPTSVLSTARDIITLWVARMVIFGLFNCADVPFRDVYIHPVIQDGHGKRMSKSAGNGVDPVDIIEIYGADALRYTLAAGATETQDLRIPVEPLTLPDGRIVNTSERFELGRNFANKFWNAARLRSHEPRRLRASALNRDELPIEDRWIIDGLDRTIGEVTVALEHFQFAEAARQLRDFTWGHFCDWYLEFVKGRLRDPVARPTAQRVLAMLLDGLCRLLHPIMPFVTEQVWQGLSTLAPVAGSPSQKRLPRVFASPPGRPRSAGPTKQPDKWSTSGARPSRPSAT